ncbi:hypothetical protein IFM58399_00312 [Aspergillus lentulus]|uniref:uncharacterized protein n=1 Tax=Aspergillus lentulus TaxID=293939 RepID=UPI001392AE82|nr:uncharacterized protein IFM58399_00312 [Aspergillus lentulus]GFF23494.1 hypothetical protein IFM58399_00312 [Aspergillus lentulus]GFF51495.1 hypothetical protein IFM62136_01805 [Aspergillus lentulus]GFF63251.1 hypothetical protein IFM47457_00325 [Aspergillus lentulus]GFF98483.1 hypothetical protein IFM61392_00312 [Aspergillus lentulus]
MLASETSFSSTSTTTTSLPALTTPFVQPPECTSIWDITSTATRINSTLRLTTILISDPADERFSSCQPPGWDSNSTARFSFSPAVCPSAWTYHQMATDRLDYRRSTAYCCSSGFSLSRNLTDLYNIKASCYRTLTPGETTITGTLSHGKGAQVLLTDGIQVHEAWAISWAGSDTATMSPSLPTLTNSMIVPTWVPGEIIPPGRYDRGYEGSDMPGWEPILRFLMIGVPIIGVALFATSVWCCIWCRRVRRKERQQRGVLANPQEICTTPLQST